MIPFIDPLEHIQDSRTISSKPEPSKVFPKALNNAQLIWNIPSLIKLFLQDSG